jgi:hypothetical protein
MICRSLTPTTPARVFTRPRDADAEFAEMSLIM